MPTHIKAECRECGDVIWLGYPWEEPVCSSCQSSVEEDARYTGVDPVIREEVLEPAIMEFGARLQIITGIEELNELAVELARHDRGRDVDADIREEIADVQLVLDQLKLMFGEHRIETLYTEKAERLDNRVQTGNWNYAAEDEPADAEVSE